MSLSHFSRKAIAISVCGFLLVQLAGCGTLLYPERRGQTSGEIDPTVAILDGIGLLFFLVPGLVSFAIDFSTGAIYLPGGQRSRDKLEKIRRDLGGHFEERGDLLVLHFQPGQPLDDVVELLERELFGTEGGQHLQAVNGLEALAGEWDALRRPLLAKACY
jgi:hypothetical protein